MPDTLWEPQADCSKEVPCNKFNQSSCDIPNHRGVVIHINTNIHASEDAVECLVNLICARMRRYPCYVRIPNKNARQAHWGPYCHLRLSETVGISYVATCFTASSCIYMQ